jgi:DNA polymerase III subunit delta'
MDDMSWGIFGHEWAVDLLKEQLARGVNRHAYLITGPQGVGRRTLGLRIAQALNCPQPVAPGEPCRKCRTCGQIERMQHPDLAVIQAEAVGGVLKVEQVRELQHVLSLSPYEARFRVALLLRFEEANASASNALLKTLEEPPPQVVFILTAESAERLMATIVSRCEVLRLRPLSLQAARQGLETLGGLPPERALLLAHLSHGRPGYALRLNQQSESLDRRQAWLDDQIRLLGASRVERFSYSEGLAKDKESLRAVLLIWLSFWRDVMLRAGGASAPLANLDRAEEIQWLAESLDLQTAFRIVSALERTYNLLDRNINTRLAVEVLMLDFPHFKPVKV